MSSKTKKKTYLETRPQKHDERCAYSPSAVACDLSEISQFLEKNLNGFLPEEKISIKHFKIILKTLNLDKDYDINDVVRTFDTNKEGFVYLSDLSTVIQMKIKNSKCNDEELRKAFRLFDVDEKGFVTLADLKKLNEETGLKMTDEEMQEMMDEADLEDLGVVTEDNFVKFMMRTDEDSRNCNCYE